MNNYNQIIFRDADKARLYCPVCGSRLIKSYEVNEVFCPHVIFFYNNENGFEYIREDHKFIIRKIKQEITDEPEPDIIFNRLNNEKIIIFRILPQINSEKELFEVV